MRIYKFITATLTSLAIKVSTANVTNESATNATISNVTIASEWKPPPSFWQEAEVGSSDTWNGLYLNLSDSSVSVDSNTLAIAHQRIADDTSLIAVLPFLVRYGWQAVSLVLTGSGLAGTIEGCQQNQGSPSSIFFCVTGLISTVIGIGSSASAAKTFAKSQGWFASAANTWSQSGLENIALDVFTKRDYIDPIERDAQGAHNYFVHQALQGLSDTEVQFLGYAHEDHRLAKRNSEVHPFAPIFRLSHAKYGAMDIVSRDFGGDGIHFTIAYSDHPTHTRRDEFFQHERLNSNLMEARFEEAASAADPYPISFDAASGFDQIENTLECFTNGQWQPGSILSAQMYDRTHETTFAFASIGIFADHDVDGSLQQFISRGKPLTGGGSCG